jgi:molybdopterin synthase sulfur carrier subunit
MKVNIPTPLRSYTRQASVLECTGSTLRDVLTDIERNCPGFRFRIIDEQDAIREHIKIFVNEEQAADLNAAVRPADMVHIICALSGGGPATKQ